LLSVLAVPLLVHHGDTDGLQPKVASQPGHEIVTNHRREGDLLVTVVKHAHTTHPLPIITINVRHLTLAIILAPTASRLTKTAHLAPALAIEPLPPSSSNHQSNDFFALPCRSKSGVSAICLTALNFLAVYGGYRKSIRPSNQPTHSVSKRFLHALRSPKIVRGIVLTRRLCNTPSMRKAIERLSAAI